MSLPRVIILGSSGLAALAACSEADTALSPQPPTVTEDSGMPVLDSRDASGSGAGPSIEAGAIDAGFDTGNPEAPAQGHIVIAGRRVLVDGSPLMMRGVCWNPIGVGGLHPDNLDFAGFAERDISAMAERGINVVRTYEPLLDRGVLDRMSQAGIFVINSVYPYGGAPPSVVTERVRAVKDHPAILFWSLGNEWNYNGLYVGLSHADALALVNEAARLVKAEDASHPVATIYGELPSAETLAALADIDVWGINSYRGLSFGDLFDAWSDRSALPMFVAEYGADAHNATTAAYDPESQALAVAALTREILSRSSALDANGTVIGGTAFEWADEWWKDGNGSPDAHDIGGIAPGAGPYPDQVFNEEWWGLVDIERSPRPALSALRDVFAEYYPVLEPKP